MISDEPRRVFPPQNQNGQAEKKKRVYVESLLVFLLVAAGVPNPGLSCQPGPANRVSQASLEAAREERRRDERCWRRCRKMKEAVRDDRQADSHQYERAEDKTACSLRFLFVVFHLFLCFNNFLLHILPSFLLWVHVINRVHLTVLPSFTPDRLSHVVVKIWCCSCFFFGFSSPSLFS